MRLWTGGSLINEIRRLDGLPKGRIIIDEADVRSTEGDLLLYLVKHYLPTSPDSQVIVMSATMPIKIQEYFKGITNHGRFDNIEAPTLVVNTQTYPIESTEVLLNRYEHHTEGVIRTAKDEIIDQFVSGTFTTLTPDGKARQNVDEGSIAVMVPGKEDVTNVIDELKHYLEHEDELIQEIITKNKTKKIESLVKERLSSMGKSVEETSIEERQIISNEVMQSKEYIQFENELSNLSKTIANNLKNIEFDFIPVHSQAKRQEHPKRIRGKKHVTFYVGTTLRRAITLPSCTAVIDSGQKKRPVITKDGVIDLTKFYISYPEARQGLGRTGREQPGKCFRIVGSDSERLHNLERFPKPEIVLAPSTSTILLLASIGLDIRTADLIDKPPQEHIDAGILRLQRVGALDAEGKITPLGREIQSIPADPEHAVALIKSEKFGVFPEMAILSQALSKNLQIRNLPNIFRISHEDLVLHLSDTLAMQDSKLRAYERIDFAALKEFIEKYGNRKFESLYKAFCDGSYVNSIEDETHPDREACIDLVRIIRQKTNEIYNRIRFENGQWEITTRPQNKKDAIRTDHAKELVTFLSDKKWMELSMQEKENSEGKIERYKTNSDYVAIVNFFRKYVEEKKNNGEAAARKLCEDHCILENSLAMLEKDVKHLLEVLGDKYSSLDEVTSKRDFDSDALTKAYLAGFSSKLLIYYKEGKYRCAFTKQVARLGYGSAARGEIVAYNSLQAVHDSLPIARIGAHVKPEWLHEIVPQNVHRTTEGYPYFDRSSGTAMRKFQDFYGNNEEDEIVFGFGEEKLTGEKAEVILAEELFGRLMVGEIKNIQVDLYKKKAYIDSLLARSDIKTDPNSKRPQDILIEHILKRIKGKSSIQEIVTTDLDFDDEIFYPLVQSKYSSFAEFKTEMVAKYPDAILFKGKEIKYSYSTGNYGLAVFITIPDEVLDEITVEDILLPGVAQIGVKGNNFVKPYLLRNELAKKRESNTAFKINRLNRFLNGESLAESQVEKELGNDYRPLSINSNSNISYGEIKFVEAYNIRLRSYIYIKNDETNGEVWEKRWAIDGTVDSMENKHNEILRARSEKLSEEEVSRINEENTKLRTQIELKLKELEGKYGDSSLNNKIKRDELKLLKLNTISWNSLSLSIYESLERTADDYGYYRYSVLEKQKAYNYMLSSLEDAERNYLKEKQNAEDEKNLSESYQHFIATEYANCPLTGTKLTPNLDPAISSDPKLLLHAPDDFVIKESRDQKGRVFARLSAVGYSNGVYQLVLEVDGKDRFENENLDNHIVVEQPPENIRSLLEQISNSQQIILETADLLKSKTEAMTIAKIVEVKHKTYTELKAMYFSRQYNHFDSIRFSTNSEEASTVGGVWLAQFTGLRGLQLIQAVNTIEKSLAEYEELVSKFEQETGRVWPRPVDSDNSDKISVAIEKIKNFLQLNNQFAGIDTSTFKQNQYSDENNAGIRFSKSKQSQKGEPEKIEPVISQPVNATPLQTQLVQQTQPVDSIAGIPPEKPAEEGIASLGDAFNTAKWESGPRRIEYHEENSAAAKAEAQRLEALKSTLERMSQTSVSETTISSLDMAQKPSDELIELLASKNPNSSKIRIQAELLCRGLKEDDVQLPQGLGVFIGDLRKMKESLPRKAEAEKNHLERVISKLTQRNSIDKLVTKILSPENTTTTIKGYLIAALDNYSPNLDKDTNIINIDSFSELAKKTSKLATNPSKIIEKFSNLKKYLSKSGETEPDILASKYSVTTLFDKESVDIAVYAIDELLGYSGSEEDFNTLYDTFMNKIQSKKRSELSEEQIDLFIQEIIEGL